MSEIAEIRKLFQDLIAPDLKALSEAAKSAAEVANARHSETRAQINELRAQTDASESRMKAMIEKTTGEVALLRAETTREVALLRAETTREVALLRAETSSEVALLRTETSSEMALLRAEMGHRFEQADQRLMSIDSKIEQLVAQLEVDKRLAKIEAAFKPSTQVA